MPDEFYNPVRSYEYDFIVEKYWSIAYVKKKTTALRIQRIIM